MANHSVHTISNFAAQLYCAGAEEQTCPGGGRAGTCYWYQRSLKAITATDMNISWAELSRRMPSDRWDPVRAGAHGFRYYDKTAAAECLAGKRVHVAGDSTTRDTFYELMAVAGHPVFAGQGQGRWADGGHEPESPISSGGRDVRGQCLGDMSKGWYCVRDEAVDRDGRISFQFLMRSNSTWEREQLRLSERRLDAALVQCPFYEWFKPDAYNYSKTREERARIADPPDKTVGPRHFEGIGAACAEYVERTVRPRLAPNGRIFVLGLTPLPMWTRSVGSEHVESRIFESIHRAFGLHCRRHSNDGSWTLSSRSGVGAIDR